MVEKGDKGEANCCYCCHLLIVKLQIHAILDLIVLQADVIFVDDVPLLENNLIVAGSRLRRDQLLQVANRVARITLDAYLLAKAIVAGDLNHGNNLNVRSGKLKSNCYFDGWSCLCFSSKRESSNRDRDKIYSFYKSVLIENDLEHCIPNLYVDRSARSAMLLMQWNDKWIRNR